jgi:hypothetical protein
MRLFTLFLFFITNSTFLLFEKVGQNLFEKVGQNLFEKVYLPNWFKEMIVYIIVESRKGDTSLRTKGFLYCFCDAV